MWLVLFTWMTALAAATSIDTDGDYRRTPFGWLRSSCVHEVAAGSHISHGPGGITTVLHHTTGAVSVPPCDTTHGPLRRETPPLPKDYQGWPQYATVNATRLGLGPGGFSRFTNVMSVPDKPGKVPDTLFLFPALQNIDWIPLVDPEPTAATPFDIIQPVLQYPGDTFNRSWELKSWYATVNAGAFFSTALEVEAGDAILCNISRIGKESWDVVGTLSSSGKSTAQQATNPRLKLQSWAYNTLECYGCDGCSTYPLQPIRFSQNTLYHNGEPVSLSGSDWVKNPKPSKALQCHERTIVEDNGDVTIAFQ